MTEVTTTKVTMVLTPPPTGLHSSGVTPPICRVSRPPRRPPQDSRDLPQPDSPEHLLSQADTHQHPEKNVSERPDGRVGLAPKLLGWALAHPENSRSRPSPFRRVPPHPKVKHRHGSTRLGSLAPKYELAVRAARHQHSRKRRRRTAPEVPSTLSPPRARLLGGHRARRVSPPQPGLPPSGQREARRGIRRGLVVPLPLWLPSTPF